MDYQAILRELTAAPGVSGDEREIIQTAAKLLSPYGEVQTDAIGNVLCQTQGSGRHILLDAHMDQIGLSVLEITPEGFLRAAPCGGVDQRVLGAAEVTVYGKETLYGVVISTPPHLQTDDDKGTLPESIFIDIGLSADRAQELVTPGDRITLRHRFTAFSNGLVSAPALDDRAGLAVLLGTLEMLKENNCQDSITAVFSTREETTEGGAKAAAFHAKADLCIAVDVSFAKTPDSKAEECGAFGAGPMIGIAPSLTRKISDALKTTAEQCGIPYQLEIMGGSSGTNADVMASEAGGTETGLLSIPLRYMHTGIEMIALCDVENTAKLLAQYILSGGDAAC